MPVLTSLKGLVKGLPVIKDVIAERDTLIKAYGIAPPGHYYSPIVSIEDAKRDASRIFATPDRTVPGIALNEDRQLELLRSFETFYREIPFTETKSDGLRYYFENPAYSYSDAIFLYCMIRHLKPRRIVEVGSGFSSCAMLDTNERFFGNAIETTFIEPYPELLLSLTTPADHERIEVIPQRLQDVPLAAFSRLESGDILFVDSTHVGKVFSDVNRLFFEILPSLKAGVHIHFHDIFFPFEYPREWILGGWSWNEIYMLRCFLQYNSAFSIVLMNTFLEHFHEAYFEEKMPLCLKNRGGSIWLRKQ